ncbi:MAG: hypothetical protein K2O29_10665 [Ruminococcus sp.]|nr:hypothetical protein [Ruminococcus sp.]MDE6849203.1 hypothetical protein [Ruminococcus sp.]MDE7138895.1 hypothetical protein [Ruminococcus sp.]
MYTFRKPTKEELSALENMGFSKLCSVYDLKGTDEKYSLFYGKLRTVFGEPDYTSDDYENMYSYDIMAVGENGESFYLEVYHGASGASIGGKSFDISKEQEKVYMNAADELIALIESANPSDYVWEGIYEDTSENVRYTVKDGKAYTESESADF